MRGGSDRSTRGYDCRVYRLTSPSHETFIVLARNMADALDLALQFYDLRDGVEVKFTVDPTWASTLTGVGRQHIEEARARCSEPSVACLYRASDGWALGGPELGLDEW